MNNICTKCGKTFNRITRYSKLCNECWEKVMSNKSKKDHYKKSGLSPYTIRALMAI